MPNRLTMFSAATCAISFAAHPAFAPESGSGGGKSTAKDATKADETKTPTEQANATHAALDDAEPAIVEPKGGAAAVFDADASAARIAELEAELADLRLKSEGEAAGLRAALRASEEARDALKASLAGGGLSTTQRDQAEAKLFDDDDDDDDLVEIRVKTPMLINPTVPADYDAAKHGMIPAAFRLERGLNKVPAHIANHPFVRANREED